MAQQTMYSGIVNSPQTELSAAISNVQNTISVTDASKLPAAPNLATIGNDETAETILYTGKSGNNLTGVTRGVEGAAKSWSSGVKVARNFTNADYENMRGNISDLDIRATAHLADITQRGINVKSPPAPLVAAKGDGVTDDTAAIKAIIDYVFAAGGGVVFFPPGTYKLMSSLIIKSNVHLIGCGVSTILDFSSIVSGSGVKFDSGAYVSGVTLESFVIKCALTVIGLDMSGTIAHNRVDNVFRSLQITGCDTGISMSYSWCNLFENLRITTGHRALNLNAQSNNNLFSRCSFGDMDTNLIMASNADGNEFSSCEFYNASFASGAAVTLFQSRILISNPYIENIDSGNFASVGTLAETTHSVLIIKGGITNSSVIITIGANDVNVAVEGLYSGSNRVTINSILPTLNSTYVQRLPFSVSSNDLSKINPQFVTKWYGNTPCPYAAMGVVVGPWVVTTALTNKQYATISVDKDFAGIQLTNSDLVVGQPYVLAYALRSSTFVYLKHSAVGNLFFQTQGQSEELQVRYLPFIAETTDMSLYFESKNVGVDIALIAIIKGSNFPAFDIREKRTIYGTAAPTTGTWIVGDRIINIKPTVGQPKSWVCTVGDGTTLGTWVSEGNL